jgi:hypothetical protein
MKPILPKHLAKVNQSKGKVTPMRIFLIHNEGAGFAGHLEIETGMSVERLFDMKIGRGNLVDYLVHVNRRAASGGQILEPEDRISYKPTKIEGAARREFDERDANS